MGTFAWVLFPNVGNYLSGTRIAASGTDETAEAAQCAECSHTRKYSTETGEKQAGEARKRGTKARRHAGAKEAVGFQLSALSRTRVRTRSASEPGRAPGQAALCPGRERQRAPVDSAPPGTPPPALCSAKQRQEARTFAALRAVVLALPARQGAKRVRDRDSRAAFVIILQSILCSTFRTSADLARCVLP